MAGGGGSGRLEASVLFGVTMTGSFQIPAMANDPDFPQQGADSTLHADGGGFGAAGGYGWVVVYY